MAQKKETVLIFLRYYFGFCLDRLKSTTKALLATCFHVGFLPGLFFGPEAGGDIFLRNVVDFQQTTQHYIPEDNTLHNHRCENLKLLPFLVTSGKI
jgi:hypothetical protein